MKKFTLIAAAAIIAASAAQAAPVRRTALGENKPVSEFVKGKLGLRNVKNQDETRKASAKFAPARHTPADKLAGPTAEQEMTIITTAPEGTKGYYTKEGTAWIYSWFGPELMGLDGFATEIVYTDDNKIYMAPPCAAAVAEYGVSYIVGEVKDNVATFTFPQGIHRGWYEDENGNPFEDTDYALMMELSEVEGEGDDDQIYYDMVPCEKQTLSFNIGEDGVLTPTEQLENTWLCAAWWMGDYWQWSYSAGDWFTAINPISTKPVAMPENIATEDWNVIDGKSGYPVKVAVDGSDLYISGIYRNMPEGVIAGKLENGKVTFPAVSYMGVYVPAMINLYVMNSENKTVVDEEDGYEYEDIFFVDEPFTFDYDAEKGKMTTSATVGFSAMEDHMLYAANELVEPSIFKASGKEITEISDPSIIEYYAPDEEYYGEFIFSINTIINETDVIPTDKLFFTLYLDGEPFEFDPEDYPSFAEPTSLVQYGYQDPTQAIYYSPTANEQTIVLFVEGYETIGIQAVYIDGDKKFESKIITIPGKESYFGEDEDGIVNVTDANAKATYFDLQGRAISAPAAGQIAIRKVGSKATVVKF